MKSGIISTLAVCAVLALPVAGAMASDNDIQITDEVTQSIENKLTAEGYEVSEIEFEDGLYEAEAEKDGQEYEIVLNSEFEIVSTELDD
ncbi:MAG: PepSY domain-containing protein [Paracoccaceae bacterium]